MPVDAEARMSEQPADAEPHASEGVPPTGGTLDAPAVPFLDRRANPRPRVESVFVRVVATAGIVGICVAVAAILGTQSVAAWTIGLVVSALSVVLAAILWSSRTL
jgi:hypothetical protein